MTLDELVGRIYNICERERHVRKENPGVQDAILAIERALFALKAQIRKAGDAHG